MSYSVGVKNIFELLGDENDDQPSVKTPQTQLDDKPAVNAKTTQKPVKREPPVGDKPARGGPRDQNRPREGGNPRSPKPRGDRPPREGGDRPPREGGDRPRGPRPEGDRPRGPRPDGDKPRRPRPDQGAGAPGSEAFPPRENGDRRFRGESRHHKGEEREKENWQHEKREQKQFTTEDGQVKRRVFDRKSGTGRPRTENKKGGAGGANWGSETDPQQQLDAAQEVKEETAAEQTEEGAAPAAEVVSPTPKRVEEEDKSISYEEYLAKKASAALPALPEARRAGEGVSEKEKEKWAQNTVTESGAINAKKTVEEEAQEVKEKAAKKQTVALDQLFHIKPRPKPERESRDGDRRRDDNDQRGRRNDRPRGDRGDKFKGNKSQKAPAEKAPTGTINDKEFPTLAVKA